MQRKSGVRHLVHPAFFFAKERGRLGQLYEIERAGKNAYRFHEWHWRTRAFSSVADSRRLDIDAAAIIVSFSRTHTLFVGRIGIAAATSDDWGLWRSLCIARTRVFQVAFVLLSIFDW